MKKMNRFGAALALAAMIAGGVASTPARLEAKGKPGPPPNNPICSYLLSVITYQYVDPTIQAYAISLYIAYGCDVSLLP